MVESALDNDVDRCIEQLVQAVHESGCTLATVESLTGGQLAAAISAAPQAGDWYRGGIVAYHPDVKHTLLKTPPGPVVTAETAAAMARSAVHLLGADYSVALTGVGGPGEEEGAPPGTVTQNAYTHLLTTPPHSISHSMRRAPRRPAASNSGRVSTATSFPPMLRPSGCQWTARSSKWGSGLGLPPERVCGEAPSSYEAIRPLGASPRADLHRLTHSKPTNSRPPTTALTLKSGCSVNIYSSRIVR